MLGVVDSLRPELDRSGGEAKVFGGDRTAVGETRVVVGGEVYIIPALLALVLPARYPPADAPTPEDEEFMVDTIMGDGLTLCKDLLLATETVLRDKGGSIAGGGLRGGDDPSIPGQLLSFSSDRIRYPRRQTRTSELPPPPLPPPSAAQPPTAASTDSCW